MKTGWTVGEQGAGQRLDRYLAAPERLGSRGRVVEAIDHGRVFINGREAARSDAGATLRRGDVVGLWVDRPGSAKRRTGIKTGDLRIVYEDQSLLVVDKPPGLLSVPLPNKLEPSAYEQLKDHLGPRGNRRPLVVHRIDRDTSGLVVFAKDPQAQHQLKEQFKRREPERVYLAIVAGHLQPASGTWRDRLLWDQRTLRQKEARPGSAAAKDAISHYRVVARLRGASVLEVRLETGKRNQIRLQAQLHGHPLVGEKLYVSDDGTSRPLTSRPITFSRQALHAHRLRFRHPVDGRALLFESPLPRDMSDLLQSLRN